MAIVKKCECEHECGSEREMKARMREKMTEYSRSGDINGLYLAMEEYPELLEEVDETKFVNTPLHEAAAAGQTDFAIEILNLMPSFGKKLNPKGLSPLHLAIETGHIDTALALVEIDKQLVLVKGKNGQTPLHCAVEAVHRSSDDYHTDTPLPCDAKPLSIDDDHTNPERERLLVALYLKCPDSINVLNNKLQTAVHVAAENKNFGAVHILVNWLITRRRESVLHWKDRDGKTALHVIAAQPHCPQDLLKMMVEIVKINKQNNKRETPLDVATEEAKKVLQKAGGRKGEDIGKKPSIVDYLLEKHSNNYTEALTRAYYFLVRAMTLEMRNTVLVVAVLIATATYQGVLQPPGGLFSAEGSTNITAGDLHRLSDTTDEKPPAGRMVMRRSNYNYFMPTNTMAFILSNVIIIFVLPGHFFIILLQACLLFMCISYLLALNFISESNHFSKNIFFAASSTIVLAFLLKIAYYVVKTFYVGKVWFLRRLRVMVSNRLSTPLDDAIKRHFGQHTRSPGETRNMSVFRRMSKQYKLIKTN